MRVVLAILASLVVVASAHVPKNSDCYVCKQKVGIIAKLMGKGHKYEYCNQHCNDLYYPHYNGYQPVQAINYPAVHPYAAHVNAPVHYGKPNYGYNVQYPGYACATGCGSGPYCLPCPSVNQNYQNYGYNMQYAANACGANPCPPKKVIQYFDQLVDVPVNKTVVEYETKEQLIKVQVPKYKNVTEHIQYIQKVPVEVEVKPACQVVCAAQAINCVVC